MPRHVRLAAALAAVLILVLAAGCGDDSSSDPGSDTDATDAPAEDVFPVTVDAANGEVTVEAAPESIVSLSPTATESLFAIGAGDQVEAVDQQSDYPEGVPTTDLDGLEPNVEALLAHQPDLVVIDRDNEEVTSALADLEIPVLVQPAAVTFDDVYAQIRELGTITGHREEADAVATEVEDQIAELTEQVPETDEPLTYFHELDDTYYTATSSTFIGQVYGLVGLENIADEADDGSGYPQLSAEYLLDADPDLVFLADTECCSQTPETVAERPGWAEMSAVVNGGVVTLDDDVVSRWGPRVVDFLQTVVDAVEQVAPA
jgi:iron complex transport system substrate-binding protein